MEGRLPRWLSSNESTCRCRRCEFDPWVGGEEPLEEEMATHSSILAWRIPWTEEAGRVQSIGLQESGRSAHTHSMEGIQTRRSVWCQGKHVDSEVRSGLSLRTLALILLDNLISLSYSFFSVKWEACQL